MAEMRLQKAIASSGVLSRRKAEEAISAGRVQVNGIVVTELGTKVDPAKDEVRVDGAVLKLETPRSVVLFHKPRRVVTTKSDPEGRKTVMDFFPEELQTIKPVGRLDYDSEGMLILTDDGDLANRIMHPRYGITKVYEVLVEGTPAGSVLKRLCERVELEDGPGRFESVHRRSAQGGNSWFDVMVSEGRNRFIRRMWEAIGHPVIRLKRRKIGGLELGSLEPGEFRLLSEDDLRKIGV